MSATFFLTAPPPTEIYTLSLHDALPISACLPATNPCWTRWKGTCGRPPARSEEHTSELQSRRDLVCRLLLEKKKHGTAPRGCCATSGRPPRTAGCASAG